MGTDFFMGTGFFGRDDGTMMEQERGGSCTASDCTKCH